MCRRFLYIIVMIEYDGKKFGNTEGYLLRDSMGTYQYRQTLQKVKTGEMIRMRAGVFAPVESLANTMIDIEKVIPGGTLCMYSAWFHYNLTTQIPSEYCVAIPRKRKIVLPAFPAFELYYWTDKLFDFGICKTEIGSYTIQITDLERSVCDAIKYRNKIGLDLSTEILRTYLQRNDRSISRLLDYAKKLRVESTIKKYLEVSL